MTWLLYIFLGQLCLAVAVLVDRVFLNKIVKDGFVFAFLVGVLSLFAFVLLPFGVRLPSWPSFFINLAVGVSLSVGMLFFFLALARGEATRVAPFVGGLTPIATFIFSTLILHEVLSGRVLLAVCLLIVGSVILLHNSSRPKKEIKADRSERVVTYSLAALAAVAFALSFVLGRLQYLQDGFVTSFFWQRGGTMLVAAILFLQPRVRVGARAAAKELWSSRGVVFLASKAVGALGYLLIGYATKLISATIVNALQGMQYLFLLVAAVVVALVRPRWLKENVFGRDLVWKSLGVILVVAGLAGVAFL